MQLCTRACTLSVCITWTRWELRFWRFLICISRLRPAHIAGGLCLCVDNTAEFMVEAAKAQQQNKKQMLVMYYSECRLFLPLPYVNEGHMLHCATRKFTAWMKVIILPGRHKVISSFIFTAFILSEMFLSYNLRGDSIITSHIQKMNVYQQSSCFGLNFFFMFSRTMRAFMWF